MQKVICAWRLIDDFTGEVLKGLDYTFNITPSQGRLLVKSDGYFVWVGDEGCEQIEVTITSKRYRMYKETILCQQLNPRNPTITVRLFPNKLYEKQSLRKVSGKITASNQEVILIPKLEKSLIKFGGMQTDEELRIHRMAPLYINHLNLMILSDQMQDLEIFQGTVLNDLQGFKLNKPLKQQYQTNSEIVRVYRSISDEEGNYTIILDDFYEFKTYWIAYITKNKWIKTLESID